MVGRGDTGKPEGGGGRGVRGATEPGVGWSHKGPGRGAKWRDGFCVLPAGQIDRTPRGLPWWRWPGIPRAAAAVRLGVHRHRWERGGTEVPWVNTRAKGRDQEAGGPGA